MTDNEIIKALECCMQPISNCDKCPLYKVSDECFDIAKNGAVDIINRQQAEIERLETEKDNLIRTYAECQAEVVEEFANKVENEIDCQPHSKGMQESAERYRIKSIINNLLKETVGDERGKGRQALCKYCCSS